MYHQLRQYEYDLRYMRIGHAQEQRLALAPNPSTSLHVVYMLGHVEVSGAVKIVIEHANRLNHRGVRVSIVSHFPQPDWLQVEVPFIQVPFGLELAKGIPLCDVIVATYWDQIQACIETQIAPVVYFEQGDLHLFHPEELSDQQRTFVNVQMKLPEYIITVSQTAAALIKDLYHKNAEIIHNAVDNSIFHANLGKKTTNRASKPYILMLGSDQVPFKGIADIVEAFEQVRVMYPDIQLRWITPDSPVTEAAKIADEVYVSPPQETIANLFREAALFISGSHYESFSLPVLEAMACGCPVVTTANVGVQEYARHEHNAILVDIGDVKAMADGMLILLRDEEQRLRLRQHGIETAKQFQWGNVISKLHQYLLDVAQYKVIIEDMGAGHWKTRVDAGQFFHQGDYEKFQRLQLQTSASIIEAPVAYRIFGEYEVAVWEIVAENYGASSEHVESFYGHIQGGKSIEEWPYQDAYLSYVNKNYAQAIAQFDERFRSETNEDMKLVYLRWVAMCLIAMQQDAAALQLLNQALKIRKDYTDLYFLCLDILIRAGQYEEAKPLLTMIRTLGDAAAFPEFLVNVAAMAEQKARPAGIMG